MWEKIPQERAVWQKETVGWGLPPNPRKWFETLGTHTIFNARNKYAMVSFLDYLL